MPLNLDNQVLLYIIAIVFIIQFIITKYYVSYNIDTAMKKNNKRLIKKLSGQINSTFDEYMGPNTEHIIQQDQDPQQEYNTHNTVNNDDVDSIDDPASNDDIED